MPKPYKANIAPAVPVPPNVQQQNPPQARRHVTQPGPDSAMSFYARDDRQVTADYGDIDKPTVELTEIADDRALNNAVSALLQVFREFSQSEELLTIKQCIEDYINDPQWKQPQDPDAGVVQSPGAQSDPRVPDDNAVISQRYLDVVRHFVIAVEIYFGGPLHSVEQRQSVNDMLKPYCRLINSIKNGCITANVNIIHPDNLLDLLKRLQHFAKHIKGSIFHNMDIMTDIMKGEIKLSPLLTDDKQRQKVEEIMAYVMERLHIAIRIRRQEVLHYLDNDKQSLNIIIQVRVASTDPLYSKTDQQKDNNFLTKFDKHATFQSKLRNILSDGNLEYAAGKLSMQEKEPEDKDESKGGSLPGAVGSAFSTAKSGAEGGAISKPGLLIPPPASPETEIPKFSEDEIFLRLKSEASAKTAFMICKKFGLITNIKPQTSIPGAFTVTFDEKSGAERAQELKDEKVIRVERAKLSGSYPLSDVKLYCGELDESIDEDTLRAIGSQYSGLQEVVLRRTPSGQAFGILTYISPEEAYIARRGLQEADFFVTKAMTKQNVARSLSSDLSAQRPYRPPATPPGQSPKLYFSKLPGENMQFEECREFLAGLVSSVLPPGSRIQRTSVTQVKDDLETGMTFRHGFCELQSLEDCQTVMSKLWGTKSAARGFEDKRLIVNWANQTRRPQY